MTSRTIDPNAEAALRSLVKSFPNSPISRLARRIDIVRENEAREKLIQHLRANVGRGISSEELSDVAGTTDVKRPMWQLTFQDGYRIISHRGNDKYSGVTVPPSQYVLVREELDRTAAWRYFLGRRLRVENHLPPTEAIASCFRECVNCPLTSEELSVISGIKSFGERTWMLRAEQGLAIATRFTGRPDLRQGEYVLESTDRIAKPHDRHIPFEVQREVYDRDRNKCVNCGWSHDQWTRSDPRTLELHHLLQHAKRGPNTAKNLVVLCSKCHDLVHAGKLKFG